ncbi:hypothetical protein SCLCIDRAFT_24338 [Scleroderma citrinum Foug A]|uniref:Uncharacterized protein n=1 Tax=Scleroderma citrinum Foug A TaxID=1036808 RepID=A0A0C3E5Z8_9AGAM|nr:hypothetical protein SCLCIDRAFT_24338 [Scleroderma citrinum Foug A]
MSETPGNMQSTMDDTQASFPNRFTLENVAAVYSKFKASFSNNERQVAARALLRHNIHVDGTHYQAKSPGGLHSCYVGLPSSSSDDEEHTLFRAEIVQASLKDIFDAIAMQDWLDSGISFLICCPGKEVSETLKLEQVSVDLYITPCELQETSEQIGGDVTVMVQAFCQEFIVPHLHRFTQRCCKEGISAPKLRSLVSPINAKGPRYLPPPLSATGCHIQCSSIPQTNFEENVTNPSPKVACDPSTPSAAIHHAAELATPKKIVDLKKVVATPPSLQLAILELKKTAATFPSPLPAKQNISSPIASIPLVLSKDTMTFGPALLSLGPHSDTVVDRFKLGNEFLPKMWELVSSVRSSKWEQTLRSSPYNLTYEQALNLTHAMQADVQST